MSIVFLSPKEPDTMHPATLTLFFSQGKETKVFSGLRIAGRVQTIGIMMDR